jgi:hypothetical protein
MRTWGVGIFDNDVAADVQAAFEAALAEGLSVYAAAERLIPLFEPRGSCATYLALAALQLDHDTIQPKIKKKALTLIISGEADEDWSESPGAIRENRRAALHELRLRLLAIPT